MKGKLYSVGVGPGDPELMTLKTVRLIKECDVLAIPQGDSDVLVAKNIVEGIVDLSKKEQLLVYMPMVKDHDVISKAHQKGADDIIKYLDQGKNVVFITLGCPTVYATCIYVHKLVLKAGYEALLVPGVTSFCAVAARLNVSLLRKSRTADRFAGQLQRVQPFPGRAGEQDPDEIRQRDRQGPGRAGGPGAAETCADG